MAKSAEIINRIDHADGRIDLIVRHGEPPLGAGSGESVFHFENADDFNARVAEVENNMTPLMLALIAAAKTMGAVKDVREVSVDSFRNKAFTLDKEAADVKAEVIRG